MWGQHSWRCSEHLASCEGPGDTTCINQAQELKEMPLWCMDLITLEKYKTCSSFYSFSSLTHIHRDTHINLASGSVIWCRSKSSWRHEIQGTILALQDWMQVDGEGKLSTESLLKEHSLKRTKDTGEKKNKNIRTGKSDLRATFRNWVIADKGVFQSTHTVSFGHGPLNSFNKLCVLTMFKSLQLVIPTTILTVWRFFLEINDHCGFTLTGFGDDTKVSLSQLKGTF